LPERELTRLPLRIGPSIVGYNDKNKAFKTRPDGGVTSSSSVPSA
jgi:hypothetical protein